MLVLLFDPLPLSLVSQAEVKGAMVHILTEMELNLTRHSGSSIIALPRMRRYSLLTDTPVGPQ